MWFRFVTLSLTFQGHQISKVISPFERPHMISYLGQLQEIWTMMGQKSPKNEISQTHLNLTVILCPPRDQYFSERGKLSEENSQNYSCGKSTGQQRVSTLNILLPLLAKFYKQVFRSMSANVLSKMLLRSEPEEIFKLIKEGCQIRCKSGCGWDLFYHIRVKGLVYLILY